MPCRNCNGLHALFRCPELLKLNVSARAERVRQLKLCAGCLRRGHTESKCTFGFCARCPGKVRHNTVLCPNPAPLTRRGSDPNAKSGPSSKRRRVTRPPFEPSNEGPTGLTSGSEDWDMGIDGFEMVDDLREPTPPPHHGIIPPVGTFTIPKTTATPPLTSPENLQQWTEEMRQDCTAAAYLPQNVVPNNPPADKPTTTETPSESQSIEQLIVSPPAAAEPPATVTTPIEPPATLAAPTATETTAASDARRPNESLEGRIQRMLLSSPSVTQPAVGLEPDEQLLADDPNSQIMGDEELDAEIRTDQSTSDTSPADTAK